MYSESVSWNEEELLATFESLRVRKGDSASVEVKRAEHGLPESLAETSCAFANMPEGGTIILGVDDPSFEVIGVRNAAELEAGLVSQARNAITPPPQIHAYTVEVQGKPLVVAEVVPLRVMDRPATYAGKAYLRQSDGDYVMHEHELRMLDVDKLHATEQVEYDKRPVTGLTLADLQPDLLSQYLANTRRSDPRLGTATDSDILRWTGVVVTSGEPTVAGLYALGFYPQGEFPSLRVTAAVQLPGGSDERAKNLVDFTGPIPVLLKELMSWVEHNVDVVRRYRDDGHMMSEHELPLRAVRELVVNALVHRDLGPNTLDLGKSIQIRLTPTGLFILNPGGLRGGIATATREPGSCPGGSEPAALQHREEGADRRRRVHHRRRGRRDPHRLRRSPGSRIATSHADGYRRSVQSHIVASRQGATHAPPHDP